MRIEKIFYEQLFPTTQFANQRYGMDITIEETDSIIDAYKSAKAIVEAAFKELNPDSERWLNPLPGSISDHYGIDRNGYSTDHKDKRVEAIIGDIELCAAIDDRNGMGVQVGLLAYESSTNSDPRIKAAYDLKMVQLKQK